jgi:hypothetical protein
MPHNNIYSSIKANLQSKLQSKLKQIQTKTKTVFSTVLLITSVFSGIASLSQIPNIPNTETIKNLLSTVTQPIAVSATGNCDSGYTYVGKDICRKIFSIAGLPNATYPCTNTSLGGIVNSYLYSVSNRVGTCYHDIAPVSFTCPAGQYLPTQGTDSCIPCDAGYYCSGGTGVAAVKMECGVGYFCPGGSANRTICTADYYCSYTTNSYPFGCDSFTTSTAGSIVCAITTPCENGFYSPDNLASSCVICPATNYCPNGVTTPIPCPPQNICRSGSRYLLFLTCEAGFYCPIGSIEPILCSPNFYCLGKLQLQTPCPIGTSSPAGTGSLEGCIPNSCPAGQTLTAGVCALVSKPYGDVKYSVNGIPVSTDTLATPGGTVTQRVYYDNTTTGALTDVSVKTSLPSGFTYIQGSLQHCKEPTESETTCDTQTTTTKDQMFDKLTGVNGAIGISPAAGFYDAADTGINGTAPLSEKGILDAGKKRYLNLDNCQYSNAFYNSPQGFQLFLGLNNNDNIFGSKSLNSTNMVNLSGCAFGDEVNRHAIYEPQQFNLLNNKYFYLSQCSYTEQTGNDYERRTYISKENSDLITNSATSNLEAPIGNKCTLTSTRPLATLDVGINGTEKATLLANRYLNMSQCVYRDSLNHRVTNIISTIPNATNTFNFKGSTTASNTPLTTSNCAAGGGNGYVNDTTLSAHKAIDMLDTSRAKGYFEFKMIVPTTSLSASYSVPVTMSAKTFGAGVDGAGGVDVVPVVTNGIINIESATLNIKANLAGAFDSPSIKMTTNLSTLNLLPNSKPYSVAPFSYTGTENLPSVSTRSDQICDWVLVEVRDTTTDNGGAGNVLATKAAVILSDGTIIDSVNATTSNVVALAANNNTGIKGVNISGLTTSGNYKVTLRHRNHIAISTNSEVNLTLGGIIDIDFTSNQNVKSANQQTVGVVGGVTYNPSASAGTTGSYIYGLVAGNANGDSAIASNDRSLVRNTGEISDVYDGSDINLDGDITATDRNWVRNTQERDEII